MASITPGQIDDGSSDNCGSVTLSLSQDMFDCDDLGDNTVTLTVEDGCGNTDDCTATVTVGPVITLTPQTPSICTIDNPFDLTSLQGDITMDAGTFAYEFEGSGVTDPDMFTAADDDVVIVTFTADATGCTATTTITFNVDDSPVVMDQTDMICSGDALNFDLDALISGSGDTYTYTVLSSDETNVPAGQDRVTASADPIIDSYTNTTGTDVTVTYTITPTATNGCAGAPFDLVVTVKAEPAIEAVITAPDNVTADAATPYTTTVCSGELFDIALNALSDDPNSLSNPLWVQINVDDPADLLDLGMDNVLHVPVDGAAIDGPLENNTGSPATVTVTFVPYYETMPDPTAELDADECAGQPVTVTVTVVPEPEVSADITAPEVVTADADNSYETTVCSGELFEASLVGGSDALIGMDTALWVEVAVTDPDDLLGEGGDFVLHAPVADASVSELLENTTSSPATVTVTLTPYYETDDTPDPDASVLDADECAGQSVTVEVTVNPAAIVDAGPDQTVCANVTAVSLNGSVSGGATTGTWDTDGTGTFDPDDTTLDAIYIPSAADSAAGSVILTLSAADPDGMGPCPAASDQLAITFSPAATADAGMNDTICGVSPVALSATASGPGEWSGGAGNFADPTSTNTTYTPDPSEVGTTVTLTWTTADPDGTTGPCSEVSDEVDITFDSPAEVDAGMDQTVCADDADVTLAGSIGGSASSGSWSGGEGTFMPDANSLNATYEPTADEIAAGSLELILTSDDPDGPCAAVSDTILITFDPVVTVDAGANIAVCSDAPDAVLSGMVGGAATGGSWTSDGTGTFIPDANTLDATYEPSMDDIADGTVILTLTTDDPDGPCEAVSDQLVLTINPAAEADAGPDQAVCADAPTVTLSGNVDGSATNGSWSGGLGTFTPDANSLNATYEPTADEIAAGSLELILTSDDPDGPCAAVSDTILITFDPVVTVDAGANIAVCSDAPDAVLSGMVGGAATGGSWTSDGTGTFIPDANTLDATYEPSMDDIADGTVILTLTTDDPDGPCEAVSDQLVLTINPAAEADAGPDQAVCADAPTVTLSGNVDGSATNGSWSGGLGTFTPDANSLNATYEPTADEIAAGSVTLVLTTDDPDGMGPCPAATDEVVITINPLPVLTPQVLNICSTDLPFDLTSLEDELTMSMGGSFAYAFEGMPVTDPEMFLADSGDVVDVTFTDANGCVNATTITFNVNSGSVGLTPQTPVICEADNPFDLTGLEPSITCATGTFAYAFEGSPVGDPTAFTAEDGDVVEVIFTPDGSMDTEMTTITFTVNPTPVLAALNPAVCPENIPFDLTTLEEEITAAPGMFSYSIGGTPIADETAFALMDGDVVDVVFVDGSTGCTNSTTLTFSISPSPVLTAQTSTICEGDNPVDLSDFQDAITMADGDFSYSLGGMPITTLGSFTATDGDEVDVTFTDATTGCTATTTITFGVEPDPVLVAQTVELCEEENPFDLTSLESAITGEAGTFTYAFEGDPVANPMAFNALNGNVVTVTFADDDTGCTATTTITFTVNPTPDLMPQTPEICAEDNPVDLTGLEDNLTALSGTFSYTFGGNPVADAMAFNALNGNVVTVTFVEDGTGCTATTTITYTVNPTPVLTAQTVNICDGDPPFDLTSLQDDITAEPGTFDYTFSGSPVPDPTMFDATDGDVVNVTFTDANGCVNATTITFSVNAGGAGLTDQAVTLCAEENPFDLTGLEPAITCADGDFSYELGGTTITDPTAFTAANGNVVDVTFTPSGGGTPETATITFTVNPTPVLAAQTVELCAENNPFDLSTQEALITGDAGSFSYALGGIPILDPTAFTATDGDVVEVTFTDGTTGCTATTAVTFTVNPTPVLTAQTPEICPAAVPFDLTSLESDITPETGTFTYELGGMSVSDATMFDAMDGDVVDVTFTDANGCVNTTTITFTILADPIAATATVLQGVSCNGESDGSAVVTPNGGIAPYGFLWSNGETTATAVALPGGPNSVTVTDVNGCTDVVAVTVPEPAPLVASATVDYKSCSEANTIGIEILFDDNPSSISWEILDEDGNVVLSSMVYDNALANQSLNLGETLVQGTYTINITDSEGDGFAPTGFLRIVQEKVVDVLLVEATTFPGTFSQAFTVSAFTVVSANATGGTPPFSYSWSNGAMTQEQEDLPNGDYTVTITDANGCVDVASVTVDQVADLSLTSLLTPPTCNGGADGTIDITVDGGFTPYSYLWEDMSTGEDRTGLAAGMYTVTVTDADGCELVESFNLTEPDPLQVDAVVNTITCVGSMDGSIELTIAGETGPYTITWSNGEDSTAIDSLGPGDYSVTVTDANNCDTFTETYTIGAPSGISILPTVTDVLCNGDADGAIDITVQGGTMPYSYQWSNDSTTQDLTDITVGTYGVTVTDANGCSAQGTFTVDEPDALEAFLDATPVVCTGQDDGSIDLFVQGGTPPYSYLWSNDSTTQDLTDLSPGVYAVTITDANGCTLSDSAEILEPNPLSATITSITNVSCNGGSDGGFTVNVTGGTSPYGYFWNNGVDGSVDASPDDLPPGTYTLVVTDANGCSITLPAGTINEPAPVQLTIVDVGMVSCNGEGDGFIDLEVSGGTPGYTYLWEGGQTVQDLDFLTAGTYSVTVTDANGCTADTSVQVMEPDAIDIQLVGSDSVLCISDLSGNLDIEVTGGNPPFEYLWSTGDTTEDLMDVGSGTYSVTVTDLSLCTQSDTFTIVATEQLTVSLDTVIHVPCADDSTGAISITVEEGTMPFDFAWSTGDTTEDVSNLPPGTYTVTVTDANTCEVTLSATVDGPDPLLIQLDTFGTIACAGDATGFLDVSVSGGTSPYSYSWNTGDTTQDLSNLPSGTYTLDVTDANGCTATFQQFLSAPDSLNASVFGLTPIGCADEPTGAIEVSVTGGVAPYTYLWSNDSTTQDLTDLAAGLYSLTVTDANGCTDTLSATVPDPDPLVAGVDTLISPACFGDSTGAINISALGGTGAYSFQWNDGSTEEDRTGLPAGMYSVTVTDENQCSDTLMVTLTQPDALQLSVQGTVDVSCPGGSDGEAFVDVSGGTPAYSFSWSNGDTSQNLSGVPIGDYTLVVTDSALCVDSVTVTIVEPDPFVLTIDSLQGVPCAGDSTGYVQVSVTGGNSNVIYTWSTGAMGPVLADVPAGTYSVEVIDTEMCRDTFDVTIPESDSLLTVIDSLQDIRCFGDRGAIFTSTTGGTAPYNFLWNTGDTTASLTDLGPGTYELTVTDANGCSSVTSVTFTEPSLLVLGVIGQGDVTCPGASDGFLNLAAEGGTPPYSISFENPDINPDSLPGGSYPVVLEDANGCTVLDTFEVIEPAPWQVRDSILSAPAGILDTGTLRVIVDQGGTPPYSFQWDSNAGNATTSTVSGLLPGNYTVTITDDAGCEFIFQAELVLDPETSIFNPTGQPQRTLSVFPNPTTGDFTLRISDPVPNKRVQLILFDGNGRQIELGELAPGQRQIRFSGQTLPLQAGMYHIRGYVDGAYLPTVKLIVTDY